MWGGGGLIRRQTFLSYSQHRHGGLAGIKIRMWKKSLWTAIREQKGSEPAACLIANQFGCVDKGSLQETTTTNRRRYPNEVR